MTDEPDTERVAVRTYVPAYQRTEWDRHADELDMSRAEFVRTMVQAGRRDFGLEPSDEDDSRNPPDGAPPTTTPGVEALETRVLAILEREGPLPWGDLVAELTDDVEERLDDVLSDLQDGNRVRHSGRQGGYEVIDGGQ